MLELIIAQPHRNRFIGDIISGQPRHLWTISQINNFINKNTTLKEVGFLKPIELIRYK